MQTQRVFKPKSIEFFRDSHRRLFLQHQGAQEGPVQVKRAFPLTDPDRYIVVESEDGHEFLGLIKNFKQLKSPSLQVVEEELEQGYFMPKIIKIEKVTEENRILRFSVQTDRGFREFEVLSRRHDIQWLSDNHIVMKDADGNKYEIVDLNALDAKSRDMVELEV